MSQPARLDRFFDGLLRLLPQELRERHGPEIAQVYRAERDDAPTRVGRVAVSLRTAAGVVSTAIPEHLSILNHDVRHAVRTLRQSRAFTAAVFLTLGLSTGATLSMLGLVEAIAYRPLSVPHAHRLVYVDEWSQGNGDERTRLRMTSRNFAEIRQRTDLFDDIAAHMRRSFTVQGTGGPVRVSAALVSAGWSGFLSASPVAGRVFTAEEEAAGAESGVAIVSHRLWNTHLGGRPLRGLAIALEGRPHTVVGVMPDSFRFPYDSDIWTPASIGLDQPDLLVVARVRQDAGISGINRALAMLSTADHGFEARSLRESVAAGRDRTAWLLLGAVAILLAIACSNVAHLLIAHLGARRREFAIRSALGADRRRQVRQCVTEITVLFAASAAFGLVLAAWLSRAMIALVPPILRTQLGVDAIALSGPVVLWAVLVIGVIAVVLGVIAAVYGAPRDAGLVLKEDGSSPPPERRGGRIARATALGQVALAVVLGSVAGFLAQSVERSRRADLGFDPASVLTFQLDLTEGAHQAPATRAAVVRDALHQIERTPGVVSAGVSTVNPICCYNWAEYVEVEGHPTPAGAARLIVHHREISSNFLATMGVPLLRGRGFTREDDWRAEPKVIVDTRFAERFWPGGDAIGRRVRAVPDGSEPGPWMTIVGVAGAVQDRGMFPATWYLPFETQTDKPSTARVHVMVKTDGDPMAFGPGIRRALAEADTTLAAGMMTTMEEVRADGLAGDRLAALVLSAFAAFGLLLAAVGIYGVTAHGIERRIPEFGVRMALGSTRGGIVRTAAGRPLRLAARGCAAGAASAWVLGAILERAIFNTTTADPAAIVACVLVVVAVTALACGIPAVRAARIPASVALRRRGDGAD